VLAGWFGLRGVFLLGGAALLLAAGFGLLMRRLHRPRTG
jgi:hypothetical protein